MPPLKTTDQNVPSVEFGSTLVQPFEAAGLSSANVSSQILRLNATLNAPEPEWPQFYDRLTAQAPNLCRLYAAVDFMLAGCVGERMLFPDGNKLYVGEELRAFTKPSFYTSDSPHPKPVLYGQVLGNVVLAASAQMADLLPDSEGDLPLHAAERMVQWAASRLSAIPSLFSEPLKHILTLPCNQRCHIALQAPSKAALYGLAQNFLMIPPSGPQRLERLKLASADDMALSCETAHSTVEALADPFGSLTWAQTFFPQVTRLVHQSLNFEQPNFVLTLPTGESKYFQASELTDLLIHLAKHQLQAGEESPPEMQQFMPIAFYTMVADCDRLPVPAKFYDLDTQSNQLIERNKEALRAEEQALLKRRQAVELQEEARRLDKQAQVQRYFSSLPNTSSATKIEGDTVNVLMLKRAPRENSSAGIGEHHLLFDSSIDSAPLFDGLDISLRQSHVSQYVSYCTLPHRVSDQQGVKYTRDNGCAYRAAGMSLLFQLSSAAELNQQLEEVGYLHGVCSLDVRSRNVIYLVVQRFLQSPAEAMYGLRPSGLDQPAGVFSGLKIEDLDPSRGDLRNQRVESVLKTFLLDMANGARGTEKPRMSKVILSLGRYPLSLVEAEVVVAIHRVLNKPCLVIQHSIHAGTSALLSGTREQEAELEAFLASLPRNDDKFTEAAFNQVLNRYQHLPIIVLHDEHYGIYLPKSNPTVQKLLHALFNPQHINPSSSSSSLARPALGPALPSGLQRRPELPAAQAAIRPTAQAAAQPVTDPGSEASETTVAGTQLFTDLDGTSFLLNVNRVALPSSSEPSLIGELARAECMLGQLKFALDQAAADPAAVHLDLVSPAAFHGNLNSVQPGLALLIDSQIKHSGSSTLKLGPYRVLGMKLEPRAPGDPDWVRRQSVEVEVLNPDTKEVARTLQLALVTAAPPFTDQYIHPKDLLTLEEAYRVRPSGLPGTAGNTVLLSYHGMVRAPALAVMAEARRAMQKGLITELQQIDAFIDQCVQAGRRDRGPGFLANRNQLNALREAIEALLNNHRLTQLMSHPVDVDGDVLMM